MDTAIKSKASEVLLANDGYSAACRFTPFSDWYKGDHKRAFADLQRQAVKLRALLFLGAGHEEVLKRVGFFLSSPKAHSDSARRDMIEAIKKAIEETK